MDPKIPYGSEAYRKKNPHLFPVGAVGATKSKPDKVRSLGDKPSSHKSSKSGVVFIIAFVPFCKRATDDDNRGSGPYKGLRDSIARTLGVDDGDPRLRFEYHPPVITRGATGTQIIISRI